MKLNLLWSGHALNGYINVDPFGFGEEGKVVADVKNLDDVVDDAEATEIIAEDIIDFLPLGDVERVIEHWIKKLRHGGKIIVGGTDMFEVCKAFSNYTIDLAMANYLLHGAQEKPWEERHANFTLIGLAQFLKERGLNIISKRIYGMSASGAGYEKNYHMYVEAVRP